MLVCVGLVCLGAAAASSARLQFKSAGYSIDALDAAPGNAPYQSIMMFLPASEGFAPNVNVQMQPYSGGIDAYIDLSKKQFVTSKFNLLKETRLGKNAVVLEYAGLFQGRDLHWYAKAVATGKRLYMVTSTATNKQWAGAAPKLKACVDSFAVDSAK
jgi:hypothetical protein